MRGRTHHRQIRRFQLPVIPPRMVVEGVVILALFFCPLALGSVPAWAIGIMLGLAVLSGLVLGLSERHGTFALPLVGALLCGIALYVGLQCLPLPMGLLRFLSPQTAGSYSFSLEDLPGAAGWHPLSLDGPATGRELAKALAYAVVFFVAYQLATSRRVRRRIAAALALSGLLIAAIGYVHRLLGLGQLFGRPIYEVATPRFVTTFGNSNNAAGLFVLCAPIALGLALRSHDGSKRVLWGLAYLLIGAAVFLTVSRGGMAAFLIGQIVFAAILWRNRPPPASESDIALRAPQAQSRLASTLIAVAAVLSVAGYLGYQPIADRLSDISSPERARHTGKLVGFVESLGMVRDFPLTGIGRGAFPTTSARYLSFAQTAEYVENEPIQLAVDLGIPAAIAVLLILLFAFVRAGRLKDLGPLELGLWVGLLSLGLQNLADFSLELGGVALPAAVALALILSGQARSETQARPAAQLNIPAWAFLACLAAGLPLAAWTLVRSSPDWRVETDRFAKLAPFLDGDAAAAAAGPVLLRHPTSYLLPLAVADRYLHDRMPGAALSWANRAMYFRHDLSAGHLIAATSLAELGRKEQALLEARTYFKLTSGHPAALKSVARFYPAVDDLRAAVDDSGHGLLGLAGFLRARGRLGDAARVAELAVVASPEDPTVHEQTADVLTSAGQVDEAEAEAQRAIALAPDQSSGFLALENARAMAGDLEGAEAALAEGLRVHPVQDDLVLALVKLQLSMGHAELAEASLHQLGPQVSEAQRAQLFALQGAIYAREGRTVKAEEAYRNAVRLAPGAGYAWTLVQLLEGDSQLGAAQQVLQELRASVGEEQRPAIDKRVAQEQERMRAVEEKANAQTFLRSQP